MSGLEAGGGRGTDRRALAVDARRRTRWQVPLGRLVWAAIQRPTVQSLSARRSRPKPRPEIDRHLQDPACPAQDRDTPAEAMVPKRAGGPLSVSPEGRPNPTR